MTTLKGLIIKEEDRSETSKSITVLTAEKGVIKIFVRGGKKSVKTSCATQIFSYSSLCFDEKKDAKGLTNFYLDSCESIKIFYNLRLDSKRLALAYYFCELILFSGIESGEYEDTMRLTLNSIYFLDQGKKDMELLKSIFEFRLMCEIGLRPKLLCCSRCFAYEKEIMHFNFKTNEIECDKCCYNPGGYFDFILDKTLLYIIRYIALTDFERLFSFKISPKYQAKLTEFSERYVYNCLQIKFPSLDFYRSLY